MKNHGGILASLEGISGCGKTYLISKLQDEWRDTNATFIVELSDRKSERLDQKIIEALYQTNDRFFRGGSPRTETFLLLALKVFDYETTIIEALNKGEIVIEDRSIDTIAVYQSIMLCLGQPERMLDTANEIYALAAKWRYPPDITFLIEDEFDIAVDRAQTKVGRIFTDDELDILHNAAHVYSEYASQHADRIVRLDRRKMDKHQIVEKIKLDIMAMTQGK